MKDSSGNQPKSGYIGPALFSVILHVGIAGLAFLGWSAHTPPTPVIPHMQAVVIDADALKQMTKPEPRPAVKKEEPKREEEQQKKRQEQEKQRQEELKRQEQAKQEAERKAAAEKKREQEAIALKKKQEEERKKKEEEKRQVEEKRKAEEKKQAEEERKKKEAERKKKEEEKRLAEQKQKELERQMKEAREKKRQEELKKAEELKMAQEAAEYERRLQEQLEAESAAQRQQRELTEVEKYRALIYSAVTQAWLQPPGEIKGLKAELQLQLLPTGELLSVKVVKSSGNSAFDQSAISAANAVRKYSVPSDPGLFNREFRNVTFIFNPK
ncbi:TolA family protein [Hahella chejuensis KCTC 2396]|uniref:TolA family protein n=1 Tax=Hahella chejuensis (strain KCTC 2396) TaxID=349521 RepID=Q2SCL7_HAHCH|nr:cell envelope integrity protein TolA [Hahella chejuensis]ABC31607.1 TolA family protein [Hahella chejuensis KCTC 2396]